MIRHTSVSRSGQQVVTWTLSGVPIGLGVSAADLVIYRHAAVWPTAGITLGLIAAWSVAQAAWDRHTGRGRLHLIRGGRR